MFTIITENAQTVSYRIMAPQDVTLQDATPNELISRYVISRFMKHQDVEPQASQSKTKKMFLGLVDGLDLNNQLSLRSLHIKPYCDRPSIC